MERRPHEGFVEGVFPYPLLNPVQLVVFEPVEKVQCENGTRMIRKHPPSQSTWISLLFRVASEIPFLAGSFRGKIQALSETDASIILQRQRFLGVKKCVVKPGLANGIVPKRKRQNYDSNFEEMMFVCVFFHMLEKRHEKSQGIIVRCFSLELFVAILVGRWWREHAETQRQLFESLVFASTSVDLGITLVLSPWLATWWSTAISFRGWTFIWFENQFEIKLILSWYPWLRCGIIWYHISTIR